MPRERDEEAAELLNREQLDEGTADEVGEDALEAARGRMPGLSDSVKGPGDRTAAVPDDTPDLVDRMNDMVRSGRIDTDAFAGEPAHDDEEGMLRETDVDEDEGPLLETVADDGDDPLGAVASDMGTEDEMGDDAGYGPEELDKDADEGVENLDEDYGDDEAGVEELDERDPLDTGYREGTDIEGLDEERRGGVE
jgi:hypothetical protein